MVTHFYLVRKSNKRYSNLQYLHDTVSLIYTQGSGSSVEVKQMMMTFASQYNGHSTVKYTQKCHSNLKHFISYIHGEILNYMIKQFIIKIPSELR